MPHTKIPASEHELLKKRNFFKRLNEWDALYAAFMMLAAGFAEWTFPHITGTADILILWGAAATATWAGWRFKTLRGLIPLSLVSSYAAVGLYNDHLAAGQHNFLLAFFLSSRAAVFWLCVLTFFAFICSAIAACCHTSTKNAFHKAADRLALAASFMGLTGLLVRWHESYLLRPAEGNMPVTGLYDVLVLLLAVTLLMYRYCRKSGMSDSLNLPVYGVLSAVGIFLLWYGFGYGAQTIVPPLPALQSRWIRLHVPANMIGYGAFILAAVFSAARLWKIRYPETAFLPQEQLLGMTAYRLIAFGFVFFTAATVLGALWAEQAWGRYWSWDPKETWALAVWLNYALWLHLYPMPSMRGKVSAVWATASLVVTLFAFLGVNFLMGGLHTYGTL